MKKRRRQIKGTIKSSLPCLLFTFEDVLLLREILLPLEQQLLTAKSSLPNVQFALTTVIQVRAKITKMIQQEGQGKPGGFDANEVLVLQTAVWLFTAELGEKKPSAERMCLLSQCQVLSALLAQVASSFTPTQA